MSDVWEFFQRVKNDDNVVLSINCQLCEAVYGISTFTTTLRRHLLGTHSTIYTSENKTTKNVKKRIRNHNNHNDDIKAMIKLHEEDKKERKEFEDRMINILQELVHKL